jgi:hypothetical protein
MSETDLLEQHFLKSQRSPWRKRLLISILILVPVCLALAYGYLLMTANGELQQALDEADRLDPGWPLFDLEARREVVPEGQNSGLVLAKAKPLMPPAWPAWDAVGTPESQAYNANDLNALRESFTGQKLEPPTLLSDRELKVLRAELQRAAAALTEARKVIGMPKGRYPITYAKDFISTNLAYTQDTRTFAILLGYDAVRRAQENDLEGALDCCRGIINTERSIGDEPTLISLLVRIAIRGVALRKVERILAQGQLTDASLAAFQRFLEEEAAAPLLLIGVRGERGIMDGLMQAIQNGDLSVARFQVLFNSGRSSWLTLENVQFLLLPGAIKNNRAALLHFNNQIVELAKLPIEEIREPLRELSAAAQGLPPLARQVGSAYHKVVQAFQRDQALMRCAIVLLAAERYRLANGHWPKTLSELVPTYLDKVPVDPFDGQLLRSRRLADGLVIYSVGMDGKDNGGNLDPNPTKEGTDLGVCLWDVGQRRRPPKPSGHVLENQAK